MWSGHACNREGKVRSHLAPPATELRIEGLRPLEEQKQAHKEQPRTHVHQWMLASGRSQRLPMATS